MLNEGKFKIYLLEKLKKKFQDYYCFKLKKIFFFTADVYIV